MNTLIYTNELTINEYRYISVCYIEFILVSQNALFKLTKNCKKSAALPLFFSFN